MKVVFCGDFVPTQFTIPSFESGDVNRLIGRTYQIIEKADFAVANLECALTDRGTRIRKCGPNLRGKYAYAEVYKKCGFTHLGLSNNHVMDFGIEGFRDTIKAVKGVGIVPFGYGENDQHSRKPVFIEKDSVRIAIVAVCEHEYSYALRNQMGANPFDPFDTMEDIAEAKKSADKVIVMYHGGKEQCEYPSERLRKACRAMIRAGADVVLTQHSHCIGCRECYKGGEIVYGQGDFNFVESFENPQWCSGLMIVADISKETIKTEYIPVITNPAGIDLPDETEKQQLLDAFTKRSQTLMDDEAWLNEWNAFCTAEKQNYYRTAPKNAFENIPEGEACGQIFPHYLDCEAHYDVWKTLFKTWHADQTSGA